MRRYRLIYVLCFIIILSILFQDNIVNAEKNDWTQFRLNKENNPVIKNDSINKYIDKISTNNEIRSTPVVVDDKIFVGNHDSGELSAYNIETGRLLWKNEAPNWVHSEIIHVNDRLFVGYGNRFVQENGIRGTG